MIKNEYMKVLSHKLRRLPKEDYSRAIEYFEEYFTEAGPGHEEQAIKDLGDPEEAANALIVDFAARNAEEPPKTVRKGLSAVLPYSPRLWRFRSRLCSSSQSAWSSSASA